MNYISLVVSQMYVVGLLTWWAPDTKKSFVNITAYIYFVFHTYVCELSCLVLFLLVLLIDII